MRVDSEITGSAKKESLALLPPSASLEECFACSPHVGISLVGAESLELVNEKFSLVGKVLISDVDSVCQILLGDSLEFGVFSRRVIGSWVVVVATRSETKSHCCRSKGKHREFNDFVHCIYYL